MQDLIRLELASGHPKAAYPWARRLVALEPSDIQRRDQLARIAEWTGHGDAAFRQWQWLVEHRHERHDMQRALALAKALNDYAAVDRLLARAASDYGLTEAQASNLAWVQERLGNPRQSEQARMAYLKRSPNDRAAWEELATIREYLGKLSESADTWKEIERRFGRNETSVLQRARMLAASGRPEEGLLLMRDYAARHHPESDRYWQVYGDLAWNLEYHADAFSAYNWLWDHDKSGSFEAQRLMILLREEGNVAMTLRISEQAWQRFHDPDVLLLAIESAIQVERWSDVSRLMKVADARPDIFRERRRYWLAHAQWSVHGNQLDAAEHDYRLALNLVPGDADARSGLLWVWIQTHQRKKLKRHLVAWQPDAAEHEIYWQAYAAAYRQLGRSRASLPWFRKFMQSHPDDILWMLEYADALSDAGQASGAWRLRHYLFARLWPKSRLNPAYVENNGMRTVEAVANLKQRLQGLPQAQQWVNPLLRHSDDPVVREFAMRWYFGIQRQEQAEYWLLRQHGMRLQAPAWQRLAMAMERNDLDQIQRLIAGAGGLDHASTLLAYRQLHQLDDAWVLAMDTGLGAREFRPIEQTTMLRHARDLDALSPNAAHLGFSFDHFG
ncbi:MAG: tetratricopeptide repeat protein, partial [Mariprofundaceae bacterium]